MKKTSLIIFSLLLSVAVFSQTADDALRYSQAFWQGTARSMAMGNAIGAVGADFTDASINPAGMGLFRTGEFTISPEVFSRNTNSVYNGVVAEDMRAVFDLSNLGYVLVTPINNGSAWKFFQFGFGMNRTNNYNSSVYIEGPNAVSSKLDVYQAMADGTDYLYFEDGGDPYDLGPAWYTYLLDTIPGTYDQYFTPTPFAGTWQSQSIYSRGSTNEWLFSFSGNYNDKVYVGATLGLPYIRFFRESTYRERDFMDTIPYFDNWSYTENLSTTGWGINLKLGVIVKPIEWLRIGAAFHTPTYYWSMNDTWDTYTTSNLEWISESYPSVTGTYDYTLSTPLRAIGSASVIFGQYGLFTGEYEYADYSTSRFSERSGGVGSEYIMDVNSDIRSSYARTHNFRFGTEWRYDSFSFRAGYAYYGSPYSSDLNNGKRQQYSGGIGYRNRLMSLDFAYVYSVQDEDYYLYSYSDDYGTIQTNPTVQTIKTGSYVATLKLYLD